MEISIWGIVVGVLVSMVLGGLWYSPLMFGRRFMSLMGLTEEEMSKPDFKGAATKAYSVDAIFYAIMSFVLAYLIARTGANNFAEGMIIGFIGWVGFMVPISVTTVLYEGRKKGLFYLNIFYHLVTALLVGGIIAQWFS